MNSPELDQQLEEADVYSNSPSRNDPTIGKINRSSCRSKHSETEQRRRSKINERFQSLMDIIPQSQIDQKRDKASFLLEVIEYIHFVQEKVQMYEGYHQHQMCYQQGPTKLIPWRNNYGSVVEVGDNPQDGKTFLTNDKVATSSGLLSAVDPDIDSAVSTQILEHTPISAVSSYIPTEPTEPKPSCGSVNCNKNELLSSDGKTASSLSTICSQRVLHSLTEALKSSGVNMSETMISVQLSLRKRASPEYSVNGFVSEDNCNSIVDEEEDSPTETRSFCKNVDHSQKRIRR